MVPAVSVFKTASTVETVRVCGVGPVGEDTCSHAPPLVVLAAAVKLTWTLGAPLLVMVSGWLGAVPPVWKASVNELLDGIRVGITVSVTATAGLLDAPVELTCTEPL